MPVALPYTAYDAFAIMGAACASKFVQASPRASKKVKGYLQTAEWLAAFSSRVRRDPCRRWELLGICEISSRCVVTVVDIHWIVGQSTLHFRLNDNQQELNRRLIDELNWKDVGRSDSRDLFSLACQLETNGELFLRHAYATTAGLL